MAEIDFGSLCEGRLKLGPPGVVEGLHLFDPVWLFLGDVFLLTGISFNVVEFLAIDKSVLLGHHGGLTPFDGIDNTLGIGDEVAVGPLRARARIEEVLA